MGLKEQQIWEIMLGIKDIWRERNPAPTWSNRQEGAKLVKTRIDRVMVDERILHIIIETDIVKSRVSHHKMITSNIITKKKIDKPPYQKIPHNSIQDPKLQLKAEAIYNKERGNKVKGYEEFKIKCVKLAGK